MRLCPVESDVAGVELELPPPPLPLQVFPTWWSMATLVWLGGRGRVGGGGFSRIPACENQPREAPPISAALTFDPGRASRASETMVWVRLSVDVRTNVRWLWTAMRRLLIFFIFFFQAEFALVLHSGARVEMSHRTLPRQHPLHAMTPFDSSNSYCFELLTVL